jgi:hypothetical protein
MNNILDGVSSEIEKYQNKIFCSNVYVKESSLSKDNNVFDGAFANKSFKKGEIIEYGIVRILPDNFDGNESPYVFTWSDEIPNKRWAIASGCAPFYNTSIKDKNVNMERNFINNTFKIIANRDIQKDEELLHTYKSLQWRKCFTEIKNILNQ